MKPPILRGVNVEMKVDMMTIRQPMLIAQRRPNVSEMGAERNTPMRTQWRCLVHNCINLPAMIPPTLYAVLMDPITLGDGL